MTTRTTMRRRSSSSVLSWRRVNVVFVGLVLPLLLLLPSTTTTVQAKFLDEPFASSYSKLDHAPCVSLFTRGKRMGCGTTDRSLEIGHLMYYDGSSLPSSDKNYVLLVEDYDLTSNTLTNLQSTLQSNNGNQYLKGVLVLNSTNADNGGSNGGNNDNAYPSPDSQYPQGYDTVSSNLNYGDTSYSWNPNGEHLFELDLYGLAMAYIPDSDISQSLRYEAKQKSEDDGAPSNDVVAEFKYYMGPQEMDSLTCLSWKDEDDDTWNPKCLPLGGTSVWASAGSPPNPNQNGNRNIIMVGANMDSTSYFHDLSPGANTAASNIMTILLAAKLIGKYVNDQELDALPQRIVFGLFQGETYGFIGSRSFFRDLSYPGFTCQSQLVKSSIKMGDEYSEYGCLNPLRPSMKFADLGNVLGMLSVDQVGHAVADGMLYVHADQDNEDGYGAYLANLLKYSATNYVKVASSSAEGGDDNDNDNGGDGGYPYPPTPLTSLLQLSEGAVDGAVLTGYDYHFTGKIPYHSHMESASLHKINLDSIAAAATIVARTALAAAMDDGTYEDDYETPTTYAKKRIIEISGDDSTLLELANCFLYDGQCDLIKKYSSVERANEQARTGVNVGSGDAMSTPPNYYVGVYSGYYGQPFVVVGDKSYGAYNGDNYGKKHSDAMVHQPRQMESAIHGLLNDYLGRGSVANNNNGATSSNNDLSNCRKFTDCRKVNYCKNYGDVATCTGSGKCVCKRAHYHIALDEALKAVENKPTGYFEVDENNDAGISPIFTEPYWSPSVGVRVYRDVGMLPGLVTLAVGLGVGAASMFGAVVLKVGLKKHKLY